MSNVKVSSYQKYLKIHNYSPFSWIVNLMEPSFKYHLNPPKIYALKMTIISKDSGVKNNLTNKPIKPWGNTNKSSIKKIASRKKKEPKFTSKCFKIVSLNSKEKIKNLSNLTKQTNNTYINSINHNIMYS